MTFAEIEPLELQKILSAHLPMYRRKVPHYQTVMLNSLRAVWQGRPQRLLDVGGGTGVIAEAMSRLLPVGQVEAIDVVDRFCPDLQVRTTRYDGRTIPVADAAFDAATLNNVLHHVPQAERAGLLREIRRVVNGPLYIKDHLSTGKIDDLRLTVLDALGNIPFGGMVQARYLSARKWQDLADQSGWTIGAVASPQVYRQGLHAALFPNRLETTMRFDPVAA
ncbi:MAG: class I SAM-dependent methyltransferase [Novosphingobium sp.]|uniref:class I SAM-dependent methyltransferase n=1 Tax=Novosphingobium sp. TaxID=1874826 RepID=UPI0030163823